MNEKTTKRTLITLFVMAGLLIVGFRWLFYGQERTLPEDTAWNISLTGSFASIQGSTVINTLKPKQGTYQALISQRLFHQNAKLLPSKKSLPGQIRARAISTGTIEFSAEFQLKLTQTPAFNRSTTIAELTPVLREKYLELSDFYDTSAQELTTLSDYLRRDISNKPALVHAIFDFCTKLLYDSQNQYDDIRLVIKENKATNLGRAKLMVALSRKNGIPARLVSGFVLDEQTRSSPYFWVELYDQDARWKTYDPEKGFEAKVPNTYVKFGYDTQSLFFVENGKILSVTYRVYEDLDILNVTRLEEDKNLLDIFDLRQLDIETRQALSKLLILPFCVLLTAFFRHAIGLFPYGTFTAPLLALAMVYAEITTTLVIAGIVIFLALIGRSILPNSLSRTTRLSLIFTFVALSMVFSTSTLSYFSFSPEGSVILIPTIILVAVVDRFYSYMDETSTRAALIRLGVTIFIALTCIPLFEFESLSVFTLSYPEIHFITAASVLLLSVYENKKITDYKYFKLLGENKSAKKKEASSSRNNT